MQKILWSFLLIFCLFGCSHFEKNKTPIHVVEGQHRIQTLDSSYLPLFELGNVHSLRPDHRILRGASPVGKTNFLKLEGITDVLIFREAVSADVKKEKDELAQQGYNENQIHHVSMKWKDLPSIESGCRDVVAGLQIMERVEQDQRKKLYLHCTVGEDRTGLISGLYRMIYQGWSAERSYQNELCSHGFGGANPRKPMQVVEMIDRNLKPLYAHMSLLIEQGLLKMGRLDPQFCALTERNSIDEKIKSLQCLTQH